jgi:hypothetical protein
MWLNRLFFGMRIGAVLWVAAVGIVAALQASGLVPDLPKLEPWAWAVSLVVLGVDNAGTLVLRAQQSHRRGQNQQIEKALQSLLIEVAKGGKVRFEELGASVYRPSRRDRFNRKDQDPDLILRVVRYRPAGYPQQSGVTWTPSKGIVGRAWSSRREAYIDWRPIVARYAGVADMTDEQFLKKIPEKTRLGFTRTEFVAIVDKYSEILAVPIWHGRKDNKLVGVLSIDRAYKADDATFNPQLNAKGTREVAVATGSVVARILFPVRDNTEG